MMSVLVVKDLLEKLAGSHLMVFNETAEAAEWRISNRELSHTRSISQSSTPVVS